CGQAQSRREPDRRRWSSARDRRDRRRLPGVAGIRAQASGRDPRRRLARNSVRGRAYRDRGRSWWRAAFARLSSSCTLLAWLAKNGARAGPATDHAIERPEETHARHSRTSALARTETRRERRIRQVQARAHALRPLP